MKALNYLRQTKTNLKLLPLTFGASFFWDDKANYSVSSSNNYQCQFFQGNTFEKDFYGYQKWALRNLTSE